MTDARFPDRWLNRREVLRLSPAAFKLFMISLAWSVSNRTDGQIDPADLLLIPAPSERPVIDELLACGLWCEQLDGGLLITVYEESQISRAQLEMADERRRRDRVRKSAKTLSAEIHAEIHAERGAERGAENIRTGQDKERTKELTLGESYGAKGFARFYDSYPRHTGRGAAERAWTGAVKRADPSFIIDAAARFAADPNLPDKQFIPHPATWLNQDRWLDEPLPSRNPNGHHPGEAERVVSPWHPNT